MSTSTVLPPPSVPLPRANLLTRYPVAAFFALSFAGTWLLHAPLVLGQDGLGLLPYSVPFGPYVALFIAGSFMGPTLAALVVTANLAGRPGLRAFLRRYGQWRVGWQWYAIFLVGFPAVYLVAATVWMGAAPWAALVERWPTLFTVYLPALLIFPALINWGEEAGWRGFAQTRLQAQTGALLAALVVGFMHGIWHLPVCLLVQGPPALGPFDLGEFLLNTGMIRVLALLWTWIFNGAGQSILIASLTHATFNATQGWIGALLPNQPAQVGSTAVIILALCSLLVVVLTRARLGYAFGRGDVQKR